MGQILDYAINSNTNTLNKINKVNNLGSRSSIYNIANQLSMPITSNLYVSKRYLTNAVIHQNCIV